MRTVHLPERGSLAVARLARVVRLKVIAEQPKRRKRGSVTLEALLARPSAPRKRRADPKARSLGGRRLTRAEREEFAELVAELAAEGVRLGPPATFADCPPGPCARVSCRHHLGLDVIAIVGRLSAGHVRRTPAVVKFARPGATIGDAATCSLRVAAAGPLSVEQVGRLMGLEEQSVRNIEHAALAKLRAAGAPALGVR